MSAGQVRRVSSRVAFSAAMHVVAVAVTFCMRTCVWWGFAGCHGFVDDHLRLSGGFGIRCVPAYLRGDRAVRCYCSTGIGVIHVCLHSTHRVPGHHWRLHRIPDPNQCRDMGDLESKPAGHDDHGHDDDDAMLMDQTPMPAEIDRKQALQLKVGKAALWQL